MSRNIDQRLRKLEGKRAPIRSEIESMRWDELNQRLAQAREVMADK